MQSIKNKIISVFDSLKDKLIKFKDTIRDKYRNNKKKCRATFIILSVLTLLTGLIMGSYKWVDSLSQGIAINYTEGTLGSSIKNEGLFAGLNTFYYTVPNHNFIIKFRDLQKQRGQYIFQSILSRSQDGILINLQIDAKVRIVTNDLVKFVKDYGMRIQEHKLDGWVIYLSQKIKNTIVQFVSSVKFYSFTNQNIVSSVNNIFISYESNTAISYPFSIRIINVNIKYSKKASQSLQSNNTIGVKLIQQTSKLNKLNKQLQTLNTYLNSYQSQIQQYASKRGVIQGLMISRQQAIKISNIQWILGIEKLNTSFNNNTQLQKYLQTYFSRIYNATYRPTSLQPFQI